MAKDVVLIAASDLHLRHTPPPARAENQAEWYAAMKDRLGELGALAYTHKCPVVLAGDLFDDGWRPHHCPPELVNFSIDALKTFRTPPLAVPGQHDLPYHRYADKQKSAYATLVRAGAVKDLLPGAPWRTATGVMLTGFPWGTPAAGAADVHPEPRLRVAVVHRYCWTGKHAHPQVSEKDHAAHAPTQYPGFGVVLFGDNHRGFHLQLPGVWVANCGTFIRQAADTRDYSPFATLVYEDGTLWRHLYDTSKDRWKDPKDVPPDARGDFREYAEAVGKAGFVTEDFRAAVRREADARKVIEEVRDKLTAYLGGGK